MNDPGHRFLPPRRGKTGNPENTVARFLVPRHPLENGPVFQNTPLFNHSFNPDDRVDGGGGQSNAVGNIIEIQPAGFRHEDHGSTKPECGGVPTDTDLFQAQEGIDPLPFRSRYSLGVSSGTESEIPTGPASFLGYPVVECDQEFMTSHRPVNGQRLK